MPTKSDLSKYGKILGHEGGMVVLKLKKGIFSPAYKKKKKAAKPTNMPAKKRATKKSATKKKTAKKKTAKRKSTAKKRTAKKK